jgi:hypothetical protein
LVRHLLVRGAQEDAGDEVAETDDQLACHYIINWSNFKLRGTSPFFMADPFKTYVQEVRDHLAGR